MLACSIASVQTIRTARATHHGGSQMQRTRLCDALSAIAPGKRKHVKISGIYMVGPELQIFYDPNEPECRLDVQPSTWVEFAPGVSNEELNGLLKHAGRAYVTFAGELFGPGEVGPDDRSLPVVLALANRISHRRYGHLNAFRTQLLVTAVSDVKAVPAAVPHSDIWHRPSSVGPPAPDGINTPLYPEIARNAGISGDVSLEVTVSVGIVSKADVKSGDRMLSDEAVRNVKTWRFASNTNTTFATKFTYALERRKATHDRTRIEMQLPTAVQITAPSNDW